MTVTLSPSRDILLRDAGHENPAEFIRILFRTKIEIDPTWILWHLQHEAEVAL